MKRLLTYLIILIVASAAVGCGDTNTTIPNTPFEINHQITCEALIEDGYRWLPGVGLNNREKNRRYSYRLSNGLPARISG